MSYKEYRTTRQTDRTKIYGAIRKLIKSAPVGTARQQQQQGTGSAQVAVRQHAWVSV